MKLFGPEPPAESQNLLSPHALEEPLEIADIMDGELPHRQDQIGTGNLAKRAKNNRQVYGNEDKDEKIS